MDLIKLHMLAFYAGVSCYIVFSTVFYKTYTDATYDEIGALLMICALGGALGKLYACSIADRHNWYKQCLFAGVLTNIVTFMPFVLVPFKLDNKLDERMSRQMLYLLASGHFIGFSCMMASVTLTDVFVWHKCVTSAKKDEHFGQYRVFGVLGWASSSLGIALLDQYVTQLPYLAMPMVAASTCMLIDLVIVSRIQNIDRAEAGKCQQESVVVTTLYRKPPELILSDKQVHCPSSDKTSASSTSLPRELSVIGLDSMGRIAEATDKDYKHQIIDRRVQIELLLKLNRYDNYNLAKYLILLIVLGTCMQIHFAFHFQYMTELLSERQQLSLMLKFNAILQICVCIGESTGLMLVARFAIRLLGRDGALLLSFALSTIRFTISGFLARHLGTWLLPVLELNSGILFGVAYTLMTELATCYLSLLDRLLLIDGNQIMQAEADSSTDETLRRVEEEERSEEFLIYLEQLKDKYPVETIRFAIKATSQSLMSSCYEGIGFALGPLLAGLWLQRVGGDLQNLFQHLVYGHLVCLACILSLEFGVIRLMLGLGSKVDGLKLSKANR